VVVVEHCDRFGFGVEYIEAALATRGRRVLAVVHGESIDDLVRDMIDVLTWMCTRRYDRRRARNPALLALTATRQEHGGG
jgi:putative resolvase